MRIDSDKWVQIINILRKVTIDITYRWCECKRQNNPPFTCTDSNHHRLRILPSRLADLFLNEEKVQKVSLGKVCIIVGKDSKRREISGPHT